MGIFFKFPGDSTVQQVLETIAFKAFRVVYQAFFNRMFPS